MSVYDDAVKKLMADPRFSQITEEITKYVKDEYEVFDAMDFVGSAAGGLVRVHYCYGKKGFYKVDVDPSAYLDQVFVCEALPSAINDAMAKYNVEYNLVQDRITAKQTELYQKLVEMAYSASGTSKSSSLTTPAPKKTKTYLN
jgi:DNA-binding protein YbaB